VHDHQLAESQMAGSVEDIHSVIRGVGLRLEDDIGGRFSVEPMRPADLAQVLAIERESFQSPWSKASFEAELGKSYGGLRVARIKGGDHIGPVLGYICFLLVVDELQITNLAVHPEYRRRSIGWQLLLHAFQLGHAAGARLAVLEVGRFNRAARALYEKLGFVAVRNRPCYYPESREDALVMELNLMTAAGVGLQREG
jgi:ribosomal-protein-alanine N-acetyltransferase